MPPSTEEDRALSLLTTAVKDIGRRFQAALRVDYPVHVQLERDPLDIAAAYWEPDGAFMKVDPEIVRTKMYDAFMMLDLLVHELFHGYQYHMISALERGALRKGIDPSTDTVRQWATNAEDLIPSEDLVAHRAQPLERSARAVGGWWSRSYRDSWGLDDDVREEIRGWQSDVHLWAPTLRTLAVPVQLRPEPLMKELTALPRTLTLMQNARVYPELRPWHVLDLDPGEAGLGPQYGVELLDEVLEGIGDRTDASLEVRRRRLYQVTRARIRSGAASGTRTTRA